MPSKTEIEKCTIFADNAYEVNNPKACHEVALIRLHWKTKNNHSQLFIQYNSLGHAYENFQLREQTRDGILHDPSGR